MSRGYDGPEIDDFRDSGWERDRSSREGPPARDRHWQTRTSVRLKLEKLREAESRSDQLLAQDRQSSHPTLSRDDCRDRDREKYMDRDKTYALRSSEIHTLTEVAKFRVVSVEDLAKFAYAADRWRLESDLRSLKEQGLVEQRGTSVLKKESRQVLTLTRQGQQLIRRHGFGARGPGHLLD